MKKIISVLLFIIVLISIIGCNNNTEPQNTSSNNNTINEIKGYKISESQDNEKFIYCTEDNKLILVNGDFQKIIYDYYIPYDDERHLNSVFNNPYSIWSFDEYKIQWSSNSKYVYIVDTIYDLEKDKFIPLKDCVVFSWKDNKGIYLADGKHYELSADGALQNEMSIGKKIKIIEDGIIKELDSLTDGRYYVLNEYNNIPNLFNYIGDYLIINTAKLKYSEDNLQDIIENDIKNMPNFNDEYKNIENNYKNLITQIKSLNEYKLLHKNIKEFEEKYPVLIEGKNVIDMIDNDHYLSHNINGKFYLEDIKETEIEIKASNY